MGREIKHSDELALVRGLRAGESDAFEMLYRSCYKSISKLIRTNSGTENDAKDIFHDSIIILINNLRKPEFVLTAKCCVYLYSVARFQWLNKLKKKGRITVELNEDNENYLNIRSEEITIKKEYEAKHDVINTILESWDHEVCKKLILAFYYRKQNLKEIAKMLNYSYEFVRIKKHRCMKSFEQLVRNHHLYNDE